MRKELVVSDLRGGYVDLVEWVYNYGREVHPRGYKTYEVEDALITLTDPTQALPVGVGREPKLAIGALEAMLLVGGISDPTLATNVAGSFARFLDGGVLHGAYGPRVRSQLATVVRRLEEDPDTRQAVMTIWDPAYDGFEARDLPCTVAFQFRIREGRLNMTTFMRSNDVWLGVTYDFFQFTQLQLTIARALGVAPGTYTHHAGSFHLYERDEQKLKQLHHPYEEADSARPLGFGVPYGASPLDAAARIEAAAERARVIHSGALPSDSTLSERWYLKQLEPYDRLRRAENFSS